MGYNDYEISVVITGDEHIRQINYSYRGIDKPTNVLSFSMLEGEFGFVSKLLGDLVISAETAEKEAQEVGITTEERMSQLLVHGILHLIGFDHERGDDDSLAMEQKSLELIRLIEKNFNLDIL